jgi:outer membrane protein, heavy metal efflux system
MTAGVSKWLLSAASAALLNACAVYHPVPLETHPAILSTPVARVLSRDTSQLARPYLKPVAVDLAQPLDANAIAILAVISSPELKTARLRAQTASAQSFAARLLPDPTFNVGRDYLLSGPDQLDNLAAALGLDLNALLTHAVIRSKSRSDERQVRLDLEWTEWQTAGQARIDAVKVLSLERTAELYRAGRDSAQTLLDATLRAAGRGDVSADPLQAARTAAFDAGERARTAERELASARFDLTKLLGLPPGTALRLISSPLPVSVLDTGGLFATAQAQRADLQALRAGYASQEASVHKAILDQFPRLELTINASRDTTGNKLLGPNAGVTLPIWNRNRGGIAVERAARDALKAEYDARLFETRADIAAAVGGIEIARRQRHEILAHLPALHRFAASSAEAASRGDLSSATAATAAQALRDQLTQLAQTEQDIQVQWIALELLTGMPLEGAAS